MQTLLLFNNTTRDGHFWLKPQAIGLPIFCQQNATEIENAFIYVTKRSMQTLQLQLQLFNNEAGKVFAMVITMAVGKTRFWLMGFCHGDYHGSGTQNWERGRFLPW